DTTRTLTGERNMNQVSSTEEFWQLLKRLQSGFDPAVPHGRPVFGPHASTAIRIMLSGIFFEGGLKGQLLKKDCYECYAINSLEEFVHGLAWFLDTVQEIYSVPQQQSNVNGEFQNIDSSIERLVSILGRVYGK